MIGNTSTNGTRAICGVPVTWRNLNIVLLVTSLFFLFRYHTLQQSVITHGYHGGYLSRNTITSGDDEIVDEHANHYHASNDNDNDNSEQTRGKDHEHDHNHNHNGEHGHEHGNGNGGSEKKKGKKSSVAASHVHTSQEYKQFPRCEELRKQWDIKPGMTWGSASADAQAEWKKLFCDDPYSKASHHETDFGGRDESELLVSRDMTYEDKPSHTIWIGFLTPMTTLHSKTKMETADNLVFWRMLFPTFLKYSQIKSANEDYWYTFYIGYDVGDPVFEIEEERTRLVNRIYSTMDNEGFGDYKSRVGVRIYRFGDTTHAPSWAVTHLAQACYDGHIDYMYQINDDVEMQNADWEHGLISQLSARNNFGVTGPADVSNRRILTQSFVHRTHIEIFGVYFAEPFKNWWSDDWLTKVYGTANTLRDHQVTVRHQVSSEGQRYPVHKVAAKLNPEVKKGQETLRTWLKKQQWGSKYTNLS